MIAGKSDKNRAPSAPAQPGSSVQEKTGARERQGRSMRALVIAPQPFYTPRGTPLSVYYRTMVTAEQGVAVDLLTYGEGQDVAIDGVRIIRVPRFAWLGDVKVGPSALKLFLDVFVVLWTLGLLLRNRYDFVHAHEEAVFFCWLFKPLFRFKLIYDMHSSLPEQLTNFSFTKSKLLIGAFARLEGASLRAANAVITICPDLATYALGLIDDKSKHFLIENSIYEDVKLAVRENAKTGDSSAEPTIEIPEGRRTVIYAGTLEPYQGIDLLIRGFKHVLAECPDAFLLVVGGNPGQKETYAALAHDVGLGDNCLFPGRVSKGRARQLCENANVQVSPRLRGSNTPLKVYEQLDSGIPLVATDIWSHQQVLDETVCFLTTLEPEDFGRGIVAALTDQPERTKRAAAAKRLYAEKYARDVYVGKMRQLLNRIS